MRIATFEDQGALQILYDDGVIGARTMLHLAFEQSIHEHHIADQVVLLLGQVDDVGVLEDEPALSVEYLRFLAAYFQLAEASVVDIVPGALLERALENAGTQLGHKRDGRHIQQVEHTRVVSKRRIGEQFLQVVFEHFAAFVYFRRGDEVIVIGGKLGPLGFYVLLRDVRAGATQIRLDYLGEGLVSVFDVFVGALYVPLEFAVLERERVHVGVEYVFA